MFKGRGPLRESLVPPFVAMDLALVLALALVKAQVDLGKGPGGGPGGGGGSSVRPFPPAILFFARALK